MTLAAYCNVVGPVKVLTAWLPLPTCNKHNRVGVTRTGKRYLVPEARAYRAEVIRVVRPVLPQRPWFKHDVPWFISYVQMMDGAKWDDDQFLGGLRDDLVEAGLVADDSKARTSRLVTRENGPPGIFLIAAQDSFFAPDASRVTESTCE